MNLDIFKRPSVGLALGIILSILLLSGMSPLSMLTLFCIFTVVSVLLIFYMTRCNGASVKALFISVISLFLGGILAVSSLSVTSIRNDADSFSSEEPLSCRGYISEVLYSDRYYSKFIITLTEIDGKSKGINVVSVINDKIPDELYTYITFDLTFKEIEDPAEKKSLAARNTYLEAEMHGIYFENTPVFGIIPFFGRINRAICKGLYQIMNSPDASGLISAVLFGDRSGLSAEVERNFKTLGITHLLVVSGMNIALISQLFDGFFERLRLGLKKRTVLGILVCVAYMLLCGSCATVLRATVMQVIYRLGFLISRRSDSISSLFTALSVILILSPGAVYDVGLWLSFAATIGVITLGKELSVRLERSKYVPGFAAPVITSLGVSMGACIFVLPVTYLIFSSVSILSPVATLLFSLMLDGILFVLPFLLLWFIPIIGDLAVLALTLLSEGAISLTSAAKYTKELFVSTRTPICVILTVLLLVSAVIFVLSKKDRKLKFGYFSLVLYLLVCISALIFSTSNGVYIVSSDTNDIIAVKTDTESILIDIANPIFGHMGDISYITGDMNTDTYILTHLHVEHPSTVKYYAENYYLKTVVLPEPYTDDDYTIYERITELSNEYGFDISVYQNVNGNGSFKSESGVIFTKKHRSIGAEHPSTELFIEALGKTVLYTTTSPSADDPEFLTAHETADIIIFGSHAGGIRNNIFFNFFDPYAEAIFIEPDKKDRVSFNFSKENSEFDGYAVVFR